MENKKMLYAWMVIIVLFLLFLAYNINSKAVPQALLTITTAIIIAVVFFIEKEQVEGEQVVPYFLNLEDRILYTERIDGKFMMTTCNPQIIWFNYEKEYSTNKPKEKLNFFNLSEDMTELILFHCFNEYFKDIWCYKDYKKISVPLGEISQIVQTDADETKKYKDITREDIKHALSGNVLLKYNKADLNFRIPYGSAFYHRRDKDGIEIRIKKPMFFMLTIKIKRLIPNKGLSFLDNYFKPIANEGGLNYLVSISYRVEFSRLFKGSAEMEDYRKWAHNVITMIKSEITDIDDLKKRYIEHRILYPGETY